MIITKKTRLIPAPFVGTVVRIRVGAGLAFKFRAGVLAAGSDHVTVSWGDGAVEEFAAGLADVGHDYPSPGEYVIEISDDVTSVCIGDSDETSDACTVYAPMVTRVSSNASRLVTFPSYSFQNCCSMKTFDVAGSSLAALFSGVFKDCRALEGELRFPNVSRLVGITPQFTGCTKVAALHFAREHESAITSSSGYKADPTLGTGVEGVCRFDLPEEIPRR